MHYVATSTNLNLEMIKTMFPQISSDEIFYRYSAHFLSVLPKKVLMANAFSVTTPFKRIVSGKKVPWMLLSAELATFP